MKKAIIAGIALFLFLLFVPLLSLIGNPGALTPSPIKSNDNDIFLVLDESTGTVLTLTAAEYLLGTVAAEMPASYHTEALKVQTVAAYTLAYRFREQQKANPDPSLKGAYFSVASATGNGYLSDEALKEKWGANYDAAKKRITDAIASVMGQIAVYQNEPILAVYHAISGGKTESSEVYWSEALPYLVPVESEGDSISPDYRSVLTLTPEAFLSALKLKHTDITADAGNGAWKQWPGEIKKSDSGTVTSMIICGKTLTGREIREAFSLRSANFDIEVEKSGFKFIVRGYGHGVGMSQNGADYMARQGSTWQEITKHYYSGIEIVTAKEYTVL